MTERIIQRQLRRLFVNYEYILFNTFMFAWESDFFAISKTGYSVEIEVKISKADFKKDFTKTDKHHLLINHKKPTILQSKRVFQPYLRLNEQYNSDTYNFRSGDSSYVKFCCPADHLPNKFYYACPENLLKVDDIPAYAGLIYIRETVKIRKCIYPDEPDTTYPVHEAYEVKKAPFLHKTVKNHQRDLLSKYYWKHKNDRVDVLNFLNVLEFESKDMLPVQKERINQLRQKFS